MIDIWSDEIEALVDAGFATVSRNPSDHETVVAYRTAIALALAARIEARQGQDRNGLGSREPDTAAQNTPA